MVFLLIAFDVSLLAREYASQPDNYDSRSGGRMEMFTMSIVR